jgi:hypothetical protein
MGRQSYGRETGNSHTKYCWKHIIWGKENRERLIKEEIVKMHQDEQNARRWTRIACLRMTFSINPII